MSNYLPAAVLVLVFVLEGKNENYAVMKWYHQEENKNISERLYPFRQAFCSVQRLSPKSQNCLGACGLWESSTRGEVRL